ncbi:MAG: TonB-dependent receptor, partial [Bacteroidetes bacterium]|nr:TonB-dependent receptor [Bacteroidota bacterium]
NDASNDIVIRGNSPLGTLWRFEGVNIPNPNHFGVSGTTGGPVTILNNKFLSNSDFMTGAFPAEYGNTIAGVFDLKMKIGNNENHEFSGQWGFLGTEIFAEGPISKKNRSSYLFTYRYSTLQIFHLLGINIGTEAVPRYQDMSFKLNFPTKKAGNISLFGIGGISQIDIMKSDQLDAGKDRELFGDADLNEQFKTGMGVIGLNYFKSINPKTWLQLTLSTSLEHQENFQHKFILDTANGQTVVEDGKFVIDTIFPKLGYNFNQVKYSASFLINKKLNSRHTIKAGIIADLYQQLNLVDSIYDEKESIWKLRLDHRGNMTLLQPYIQWKYKVTEKLTLNAGVHGQYLTLNNSKSLEPRAGLKWRFKPTQSLSLGFGMHSQMLPAYIYFAWDTISNRTRHIQQNKNIDFLHSSHYVLAYDNSLTSNLRIRVETYYQHLSNIAVEVKPSPYSVLNNGDELNRFWPDSLKNTGTGENYGIEFTLEKFFSKSWFYMLSASLYESKYKASDGKIYNTTFNGNYIVNLLGTKEFKWGKKNNTTFGVGGKVTIAGNKRYTPFDLAASESAGFGIPEYSQWNSKQLNPYFRADIKLNYKINTRKLTHEIGLDLVNIFGTKNVFKRTYTGGTPLVREDFQLGFLPIFYYKVDF